MIMQRFEKGLYGNPQDLEVRRHVMRLLDDAVIKDIYSHVMKDEKVARWENQLLMKHDMNVNTYDDHVVHLRELNAFRKSMDYQKIKLNNVKLFSELESRFMKHEFAHKEFIKQMMQDQMKAEEAAGGKSQGSR